MVLLSLPLISFKIRCAQIICTDTAGHVIPSPAGLYSTLTSSCAGWEVPVPCSGQLTAEKLELVGKGDITLFLVPVWSLPHAMAPVLSRCPSGSHGFSKGTEVGLVLSVG